ncbi:MAG: sigma-54-dependent Fis family transcriptional regulator [Alphaproteobacteria bacterium]|nr:sigma-54-dependent Fis family transcriptional regulator [Alphaproteobacteria bacterium]
MARLLLIEDSPELSALYQAYIEEIGIDVLTADTGKKALQFLDNGSFDLLLLDLNLPDMNGLKILQTLNAEDKQTPTIVLTGQGSLQSIVDTMREGAADFLMKPVNPKKLIESITSVLAKRTKQAPSDAPDSKPRRSSGFYGKSTAMRNVFSLIERAAASNASVFITGETGTGKELCAQAIHNFSDRRDGPMVPLNCAAVPRELMESEIFGHRKGAFTNALEDRAGAAELADGGTLFLDEICEMNYDLQAKLLRFVQTSEYKRIGDSEERAADIRFVCATNQNPADCVLAGTFREDLYYRLHVIPIEMPPLRERGADIVFLGDRILRDLSAIEGKEFRSFEPAVLSQLSQYSWPGNVRELENVLRNVVVLHDGPIVEAHMIPPLSREARTIPDQISSEPAPHPTRVDHGDDLVRPLAELEILAIDAALEKFSGNVTRAARALEISPSTIYRKKAAWKATLHPER